MAKYQLPPFENDKIFEEFVCDLLNEITNTQSFQNTAYQTFGVSGQNQKGIDVFSAKTGTVVQCKLKRLRRSDKAIRKTIINEIEADVAAAKSLQFKVQRFILVSTFRDDVEIQEFVSKFAETQQFSIQYWGWDTLTKYVIQSPNILRKYFPGFISQGGFGRDGNFPQMKNLTKPPFYKVFFLDRADSLLQLRETVKSSRGPVLLSGPGGIGKTTLASQYWHTFEKDYKYLAWVHVGESFEDGFAQLSQSLNVQSNLGSTNKKNLDSLFISLSNIDGPALLIIDNANDVDIIHRYYQDFGRLKNFDIIFSTRIREIGGWQHYKLCSITDEQALALFSHYYPKLSEEELGVAKALIGAIENNVLVIELLSKNLSSLNKFKEKYSLSDLVRDFVERGLLSIRSGVVSLNYASNGLDKVTVEQIIGNLYDMTQLTLNENRVLHNLLVFPSLNISYQELSYWMQYEVELNLDATISDLISKGWLDYNSTNSELKLTAIVKFILYEKTTVKALFCELFSVTKVLVEIFPNLHLAEMPHLLPVASIYAQIFGFSILPSAKVNFMISEYYIEAGNPLNALPFLEVATTYFEREMDLNLFFSCRSRLARIYFEKARLQEAELEYQKTYDILLAIPDDQVEKVYYLHETIFGLTNCYRLIKSGPDPIKFAEAKIVELEQLAALSGSEIEGLKFEFNQVAANHFLEQKDADQAWTHVRNIVAAKAESLSASFVKARYYSQINDAKGIDVLESAILVCVSEMKKDPGRLMYHILYSVFLTIRGNYQMNAGGLTDARGSFRMAEDVLNGVNLLTGGTLECINALRHCYESLVTLGTKCNDKKLIDEYSQKAIDVKDITKLKIRPTMYGVKTPTSSFFGK